MKKILLLAASLLFAAAAQAAPFLVSDPYPAGNAPDTCNYTLDGGGKVKVPVIDGSGGKICHIDVGAVAAGAHAINVTVENVWGESSAVPFSFSKSVPVAPAGISLSRQ